MFWLPPPKHTLNPVSHIEFLSTLREFPNYYHYFSQVCVVVLSWKIPNSVCSWVVDQDNTFHDGMVDGVGEWFAVFVRIWPKWILHRKACGWDKVKDSSGQADMRNGMSAYFVSEMVQGHPLHSLCSAWGYINSQLQVMKALAPHFFVADDSAEGGAETAGEMEDSLDDEIEMNSAQLAMLNRFKLFWDTYVDSCSPDSKFQGSAFIKTAHIMLKCLNEALAKSGLSGAQMKLALDYMPMVFLELMKFLLPLDQDAFSLNEGSELGFTVIVSCLVYRLQ